MYLGLLTSGGSVTYRVCLDEHKFAPAIDSVCAKGDEFESEVYELWKIVKDEFAFPLRKGQIALSAVFVAEIGLFFFWVSFVYAFDMERKNGDKVRFWSIIFLQCQS